MSDSREEGRREDSGEGGRWLCQQCQVSDLVPVVEEGGKGLASVLQGRDGSSKLHNATRSLSTLPYFRQPCTTPHLIPPFLSSPSLFSRSQLTTSRVHTSPLPAILQDNHSHHCSSMKPSPQHAAVNYCNAINRI